MASGSGHGSEADPGWKRLGIALMLGLLMIACGGEHKTSVQPPQQIFLITIDTLRADHLGLYGYPRKVSPFIDGLGSESIVFDVAWASSSHTAPSHASLFTSLQPAQHRLLSNGEALSDKLLTVAEIFRARGFRTAAFTPVSFLDGLEQGFELFSHGEIYAPAREILAKAEEWVDTQEPDGRFFVWIHLFDVHEWHNDQHVDQRCLAEVQQQSSVNGDQLRQFLSTSHGLDVAGYPFKRPLLETINRYDGQLWSVDQELGRFFSAHQSTSPADSLWVITSDHGEGLGNHGRIGHGMYIYNEQIRVPLIFHFTSTRYPPARVLAPVRLVDVAPTLAELVGSTLEGQVIPIEGRSLLPLIKDPQSSLDLPVFAQRRPADQLRLREGWPAGEVYSFQSPERKVIIHSEGQSEIFDLGQDPFELDNLIDPDSADQRRVLEQLGKRFQEMFRQGEQIGEGEILPKHYEELKALGYL